jgi:Uma2 family endonuclease
MIKRLGEFDLSIQVPADAHTLDGFRAWVRSGNFPERGRIALIQGELFIDMNAERLSTHNLVKTEIARVLGNLVKELDLGRFYSDGAWIIHDEAFVSNEPDAVFVSWSRFEDGRVAIDLEEGEDDGIEMRGSPDWVLEVVSPSSETKDTRRLRRCYHQADVAEYWIADARDQATELSILCWQADGYHESEEKGGWHFSSVFRRWFRLERTRDRLGGDAFTLHVCEKV